jgi:L-fuconolactonase
LKIDSHQHFWKYDPTRHAWIEESMSKIRRDFLPEDLWPELQAQGISGCVAVQADETENETRFLLDLANRFDWIKKVVGWVDLKSADIESQLERYQGEPKLAGFRAILQSLEPEAMEDKAFLNGIRYLERLGFTYDVLIFPKHLEKAYELCRKFPNQPFVLDHLAKPDIKAGEFAHWSKWMAKMAELPNLCCKVSGMVTEADWNNWKPADFKPYLDFVTENFGTDRLLYGSDWPVCLVAGTYAEVFDLADCYFQNFSENEKKVIFGKNAMRFYGIQF